MTLEEVLEKVERYGCRLVEVTGGEPLLQAGSVDLMEALQASGHTVLLETAGSEPIDQVPPGVVRIMDVKCPGSGEHERNRPENLGLLRATDQVKFVLLDRADYEWASGLIGRRRLTEVCEVLMSPVHGALDPAELAGWILEDGLEVRMQLQLHRVIWPGIERGV